MLVNDCMTRHPILIAPTTLATEAQRILTENNIRHLPVVGDGKRLEGLVTHQSFRLDPEMVGSLNVWDISRYLADLQVRQVMAKAKDVVTITPERTAERAARLMMDRKVSCLPVVEDGEVVVGILTEVDLLHAFQTMLALPEEGIRVTVRMPNKKGEFAKLTAVLGQHEIGVMGVGTYPTPRREGYYDCVLKIRNVTEEQIRAALGQIPEQEIVDLRTAV
jgi:acetoin utilization protein AcuB